MDELKIYQGLIVAAFVLAAVTFIALMFITAPYGRHDRAGWGPTIPARLGWILMESPAVLAFALIFALGRHRNDVAPQFLLGLWMFHYVHRAFIFPFRMRSSGKRMPALIALLAAVYNVLNAYLNARWLTELGSYPDAWIIDPRFLFGFWLFLAGYAINFHADTVLFRLRKPGQTGYRIPRGGLYARIASPNYFGEILEWFGWAMATWSMGGLAFAIYTLANLAPRARANLQWYRQTFPDYPKDRKALIPFIF